MAVDHYLDASRVLEAALEQMDDIISGSSDLHNGSIGEHSRLSSRHSTNKSFCSDSSSMSALKHSTPEIYSIDTLPINKLLVALRNIVNSESDTNQNHSIKLDDVDIHAAEVIFRWLQKVLPTNMQYLKSPINVDENSFQKIQQLESDKKNLMLQVSVLTDQVDAQTDKINELEKLLEEKKDHIRLLEQNLHQEVLSRTAIENSKLELITEISNLRLRLTAAERDRKESDERCRKLEADLNLLQTCISGKDTEQIRAKIGLNGTILGSGDKNSEVDKLRLALDSVIASNEEKDRKIEEMKQCLIKYKKLQDYVLTEPSKHSSDVLGRETPFTDGEFSKEFLLPSSPGDSTKHSVDGMFMSKPPQVPRSQLPLSTFMSDSVVSHWKEHMNVLTRYSPTAGVASSAVKSTPSFHKSSSVENVSPSTPKNLSPTKSHYGTIPRQSGPQVLQHLQEQLQQHRTEPDAANCNIGQSSMSSVLMGARSDQMSHQVYVQQPTAKPVQTPRSKSSGVSFGKGFFKLKSGKRSSSAPELAEQDDLVMPVISREASSSSATLQHVHQPYLIKPEKEKSKGFMKFFTKWKRSGSQNIEKLEGELKRGGFRATAGPRLGWSRDIPSDPYIPFAHWNTDMLKQWMNKIDLNMYVNELRRWGCNGEQLLNATSQEIDKELGIRNIMHKKKFLLALQSMKGDQPSLPSAINQLDYQWVLRWLNDIGLPQYKDAFSEARVDGRVLHYLTVEDLISLKITNQLHHISIKRGIQLLREKKFDPNCIIRRSLPDEGKDYTPEFVALWSNHRVMEWLRTVDLSEYAPNLRGSGVHGALIVFEPKFNTDLFATLLNIPPTKTLLRRHLATHFKHVVGPELSQIKRDTEMDELYSPLTPNLKIKVMKKSQFTLKKKKGKESEIEEFVCPMDIPVGPDALKQSDKLVVRRNSDPAPQESRKLDLQSKEANEEIEAVCKEISSLTVKQACHTSNPVIFQSVLQEDKSVPTTNV